MRWRVGGSAHQRKPLSSASYAMPALSNWRLAQLVAVQPQPDRVGSIRVRLPEGWPPLGIPKIEVEVIDEHHLAPPLHVWMTCLLLSLRLPRAPRGGLLLRDADQHHLAVTALFSSRAQQWLSDLLLVLAFGEVTNGNAFSRGPAVDGRDIRLTDLAERCR